MSQLDKLINTLLKNRGLTDPDSISQFLHPPSPQSLTLAESGLDPQAVDQAVQLIRSHQSSGHPIAVYGDYDVDGITATAIVWEALYASSPLAFPHIPHRRDEGYGLSRKGIDHCLSQKAKLIITVDNGIVAHSEVDYCRKAGCDIIIIDHHQPEAVLPQANVLLHSTVTSAAGLAWFFVRRLSETGSFPPDSVAEQLSLVAISVICDLVPLLGPNRSFAKFGLQRLDHTSRPGLLSLFQTAGLSPPLNTYHVGFVIGPRLNSTGRLSHALDSLRLVCTTDSRRAGQLADHLNTTNRLRQDKTKSSSDQAVSQFSSAPLPKLLVSASPDYDEGIIGLIASRLVETYYRPAIAISVGTRQSKGSARSVPGFHITDHLRQFSADLDSVGGHAMAAGFSLPTPRLQKFIDQIVSRADSVISDQLLVKNQRLDAQIPISLVDFNLLSRLREFEPFGLGNPRPVFASRSVPVAGFRRLGHDLRHLKFLAAGHEAIFFSAPAGIESDLSVADLIYSVDLNTFKGQQTLQLGVKQLQPAVG